MTNLHPLGTKAQIQQDCDGSAEDVASPLNNASKINTEAEKFDPETNMDVDAVAVVPSHTLLNEGTRDVMMSTLRNKNKKKGFKQSMAIPLPQKIVFASQVPNGVTIAASSRVVTEVAPARLIAPSQTQDRGELPRRMFVTSVDVEDGIWGQAKKSNEHQSRKVQQEWPTEEVCYSSSLVYEDIYQGKPSVVDGPSAKTLDLDWDSVEKQWETFEEINQPEQLEVGNCIGWKV